MIKINKDETRYWAKQYFDRGCPVLMHDRLHHNLELGLDPFEDEYQLAVIVRYTDRFLKVK